METRKLMGGTSPEEAGRAATRRHGPARAGEATARDGHAPTVPTGVSLSGNRFTDVMLTSSADLKFDLVRLEF